MVHTDSETTTPQVVPILFYKYYNCYSKQLSIGSAVAAFVSDIVLLAYAITRS